MSLPEGDDWVPQVPDRPYNKPNETELENNVGPFKRVFKESISTPDKPGKKAEHKQGHSRIPSIVIDDTHAKTFVYAVVIAYTTPDDPTIEYKIRHACSTLAAANNFAMKRAKEFIRQYASLFDDAIISTFSILPVGEDYPSPDISEPGDPYLPPTYAGPRPHEDTWAICKELNHGTFEIYVRFWKHASHLRRIETLPFEVVGDRGRADCNPPNVYLAQCRVSSYSEEDNVFPSQHRELIYVIGAYWTRAEASQACTSHIVALNLHGVENEQKLVGGLIMRRLTHQEAGRRRKWCVKHYVWDENDAGKDVAKRLSEPEGGAA